jgi:3-phosphoshikimate 1-carboxyvinyltransferase
MSKAEGADALWSAPFRGKQPIHSTVVIPGSKSVTNRALILAALAESPSVLRRPLISRDTTLMKNGLIAMGIEIEDIYLSGEHQWQISPNALVGPAVIVVGNA